MQVRAFERYIPLNENVSESLGMENCTLVN